jgi:hypothetical protein
MNTHRLAFREVGRKMKCWGLAVERQERFYVRLRRRTNTHHWQFEQARDKFMY